jgi:arylamine N-acetyltransferase
LIDVLPEYRNVDNVSPDLSFLRVLHTHMISTVPYETLVLHYSPARRARLDPQLLFQKIVRDKRGRGGYCLENNLFFLYTLRDLGFQVYPVGTKSKLRIDGVPQGDFQGWYVMADSPLTGCWP